MGNLTHAAGRLAVSKVSDVVLKNLDKDREKEIVSLSISWKNTWMEKSWILIMRKQEP